MYLLPGWHERLREERERLNLSQTVLGESGGVKKQTQIAYEQGKSSPDLAYLAGVQKSGIDVQYVLAGVRAGTPIVEHSIDVEMPIAVMSGGQMLMQQSGRLSGRAAEPPPPLYGPLQPDESLLVQSYRAASDTGKAALVQVAKAVTEVKGGEG